MEGMVNQVSLPDVPRVRRPRSAPLVVIAAVGVVFATLVARPVPVRAAAPAATPAAEPSWVAEKEERARDLVKQGAGERQAYDAAGGTGPRTYLAKFEEAERLLTEIAAAAPSARRLYGLAFARYHIGNAELAHFACDRAAREFPAEREVLQRCEALQAVLRGEVYEVAITSEPAGASVTVEGWPEAAGIVAPGSLWLKAGSRELVLRLEGYQDLRQKVTVEAGFVSQVRAVLKTVPRTGTLELVASPAGARVEVDGAPVTLTADGRMVLGEGPHRLRVSAPGHTAHEETVDVPANVVTSRWVELEREVAVTPVRPDDPDGPDEPVRPSQPKSRFVPWGWATLGVGVACLGGGVALHVLALGDADDAAQIPNHPARFADFEAKKDAARGKELGAFVLYGAGAAAIATGIVLLVIDDPAASSSRSALVPTVLPGGAGLSWTSGF